jgi:uncharacterized protein (DUF736 family)
MNIAIGIKNDAGHLQFTINLPFLRPEPVVLVKQEKTKERSPDYAVHLGNATGARIGAVWKETSRDRGTSYLAGHIESPAFAASGYRLQFAIFAATEESRKGQLDMVWTPPKERPAAGPGESAAGAATAADDGDDIPF